MPSFAKLGAEIFRDYATDAVPASGANQPSKTDIRAWAATIEGAVLKAPVSLGTIGGTANAITAVGSPTLTAYSAGQTILLIPTAVNTGSVTINVDSAGAKALKNAAGGALGGGELIPGTMVAATYDGTDFRLENIGAKQIVTAPAVVGLSNSSTAAQAIFASANDALTLLANTTYRFRAKVAFNTGGTSHTTSFGLGGTATFTSIDYVSQATSSAANTLATPQMRRVAAATAAALTAASTAVTTDIWIEGTIRTNGAGTIIPQVTFSAGPTGTCETAVNSFFEIERIGSDTQAAVGNFA